MAATVVLAAPTMTTTTTTLVAILGSMMGNGDGRKLLWPIVDNSCLAMYTLKHLRLRFTFVSLLRSRLLFSDFSGGF